MSVFDQEDNFDENKDYLSELIGPGGKFDVAKYNGDEKAAIKAMAKGKAFADRTLDHKNKEFDELREDFMKVSAESKAQAKLDELLTRMENKGTDQGVQPDTHVEQPKFDPETLDKLLETKLQEIELKKQEKSNLDKVDQRLREQFGDNASSVLSERMNSLGISNEDLKYLAKRSPDAVFNTLGLNQRQATEDSHLPRSNMRSDSFTPSNKVVRDALYYEKMRKEDPKTYFSEKMSVQRLKDMSEPEFLTRINQRSGL